jgi:hypothetical protein
LFWRGLVAWGALGLGLGLIAILKPWLGMLGGALVSTLLICALTIVSIALPKRGLPDRLAGTWPVPR